MYAVTGPTRVYITDVDLMDAVKRADKTALTALIDHGYPLLPIKSHLDLTLTSAHRKALP